MTDLDVYQPPAAQAGQYQAGLVMTPDSAKALDDQLRACTRAVLREGTDYGVIPGTSGDQVLLKPGAEKLLQWFGFAYTMICLDIERDDDGRKQGVTYRCTIVKRIGHPDGGLPVEVATCEGYAGYDEDKFYKTAEQVQRKAEENERYFAQKDKRPPRPTRWQGLPEYRAPWNTIIKMAQKRALVGATIDATAAAGLFGQEEDQGPAPGDDGTTWYDQALAEAGSFTDPADEGRLYTAAARAGRDGLCTPKQAQHVQNRARQRGRQLKNVTPVDADDLGRQDAQDVGPDDADTAETGGTHRRLVGTVQGHFKRLGYTDGDRAERLRAAGKLTGIADVESLSDLGLDELGTVADQLAKCRNAEALKALLDAGETDE